MRARFYPLAIVSALALASASLTASAEPQKEALPDQSPFGTFENGRPCATPEPTFSEQLGAAAAIRRYVDENGIQAVGGQIKVAFHVIYSGSTGNIPQSQIDAQIAELNKAYSGFYGGVNTGYTFVLASVDRTSNKQWFACTPGSRNEKNMKQTLATDVTHRLNVYTCKPGQNLLGWAYFPNSYAESNYMHGVVFHYGSVPGGYLAPYNLGGTLDHEVGHYLGLYHTFQGGCTAPGDQVDDTPYQATSTAGCPNGKDTCPAAGLDPIHNYMDYSDDACYTQFTAGQDVRMDQMVPTYRPNLLNAAVAQQIVVPGGGGDAFRTGAALAFRGASPNPFNSSTRMQFTLPSPGRVTLKVYNVAGQLVRTLVDGDLSAGEQSVEFRAGNLRPGMYYTALRVGGVLLTRSVLLVR
jgi:hypothetical protein